MSLLVPLNVRIAGSRTDKHITSEVRRLQYRSAIPGGFASASFELDRPLALDPDEFEAYSKVIVYDGRDGSVEWQGRLEDPGRGADANGRIWQIQAVGPLAHAEDQWKPLIYVDQTLDDFVESANGSAKNGRASIDVDANNNPALKLSFDRNLVANSSTRIGLRYRRLLEAGLKLGRLNYSWDAGVTDANWTIEERTRTGLGGAATAVRSDALNVAGGGLSGRVVAPTGTIPNGDNVVEYVLQSNVGSSTPVPNDVYYVLVGEIAIRMLLLDASGNEILTGYSADSVKASEVVADLLGRLLPKWDGALASVTATSYAIDQLMYENGVTARQVLDDLVQNFEPNMFWAAWEDTVNGLSRFEFSAWPSTVAYEASAADGFSSPNSVVDLFNEAHVRWKAGNGRVKTTTRTNAVQQLTDAGLTRSTIIDLADELASSANAIQAGDQFLAQHSTPPNEGTLQIRRPMLDLSTGFMLQPWQIRPGKLIRVRDVRPNIDALNATDRDGVTVFRVFAVDYDSDTNTATLELDSGARQFRRAHTARGRRRVVAPKATLQQELSDKALAAYKKLHAKKRPHHKRKK